jgi:hypothetical protein
VGGFKPGEKWTVRQTNRETVTLERNGKVRQFKPSAKGKWDVLVPSTMQVSVGDQIRVTAGFREGKNVFKNNDLVEVREITDTELILSGRSMKPALLGSSALMCSLSCVQSSLNAPPCNACSS